MKNGLKGVTDATVFCKSMKKGGAASMIQPMKKYAAGGDTSCDDSAWPPGKRSGCRSKSKFRSKGKSSETRGGVLSGIATGLAGVLAYKGYKNMKDKE
jgi:hypothetical protein